MREIKFRAWIKAEKRMFLVHGLTATRVEERVDGISKVYAREDVVLMQFTHRKDKHEVKIYEGDILHLKYTIAGLKRDYMNVVGWNDYFMGFVGVGMGGICAEPDPFDPDMFDHAEVAGNIYDDKKLLDEYRGCPKPLTSAITKAGASSTSPARTGISHGRRARWRPSGGCGRRG